MTASLRNPSPLVLVGLIAAWFTVSCAGEPAPQPDDPMNDKRPASALTPATQIDCSEFGQRVQTLDLPATEAEVWKQLGLANEPVRGLTSLSCNGGCSASVSFHFSGDCYLAVIESDWATGQFEETMLVTEARMQPCEGFCPYFATSESAANEPEASERGSAEPNSEIVNETQETKTAVPETATP